MISLNRKILLSDFEENDLNRRIKSECINRLQGFEPYLVMIDSAYDMDAINWFKENMLFDIYLQSSLSINDGIYVNTFQHNTIKYCYIHVELFGDLQEYIVTKKEDLVKFGYRLNESLLTYSQFKKNKF